MRGPRRGYVGLALALVLGVALAGGAQAQSAAPGNANRADAPVVLRVLNRDVITLRASIAGLTPAMRLEGIEQRLREIPAHEMHLPFRTESIQAGTTRGVQILLGSRPLFSVLEGDVDPTSNQTHAELVRQTVANLEEVRKAWQDTKSWPLLLDGLIRAGVATGILVALMWGVTRALRTGIGWLERKRDAIAAGNRRATPREFVARFFVRAAQVFKWLAALGLGYAWATYVLARFPLTEPIGLKLGKFIVDTLAWIGSGFLSGLPGIVTVLIVLGFTRAIIDVVGYLFDNVQKGRLGLPYLHPETIGATRRIVSIVAWCLGIAVAYPFIPGSNSDAFKGLSVLIGLVLSLGSTGLVTQAMSGLVVVYSRALRRGDFVRINDIEGVVSEVATLATKVVNVRNEEITIPNSLLVASPIHNYSKLGSTHGTLLTSRVTIGYDAPWRQVHALLIQAAEQTPSVRSDPPPYVYQRALSDFYVEYELFVHIDRADQRIPILSALHASIQDRFNENGVQIMSPHFFSQPDAPVVVPKAHWFKPPAAGERGTA
ncbi:MAG: mechanosensitive ion channel family protein [Burkholderiaceae bacterium]|jgi:small-conductance mechanosensitive channel|nr:mechanosensitive ion channel family protein [Burkholderiaceae bacterium]